MVTARHVNYYKEEPYYKKYKTTGTVFETIDRPDIHVADAHPRYVTTFDKSKNQGYGGYIFQQRNDLYSSSYTFWANTDSDTSENGAFMYIGSGEYNSIAFGIGDSNGFGYSGTDIILVIDGYNVVVCGSKPEGWHHYGLVIEDDYTIHVYVDGQLLYTANEYTNFYSQPFAFVIGNSGMPNEVYDNSGAYDNQIARVCIWNKALSQEEVAADYSMNQTSPTFKEDGLYGYYSMCPVGDVLPDFGGRAGLQKDKITWTYDSTSDKVRFGPAPAVVDGVVYPPSFSYNNTGWITGCYKILDSFSPNGKPWEYVADFETPDDLMSYGEPFSAGIFGGIGTGDGCTPIYMQVSTDGQNKKLLTAFLSSNGSQWDISNQTVAEILIVEPNTRYRIKAVYDQTKYQWFKWNFTTNEWELKFTLNDSRPVYDGLAMQMGTNRGRNNGFGGIIYLKNCYIKVNDCYVWRGDEYGMGCELTAFNEPEVEEVIWGSVAPIPSPIQNEYPSYKMTGTYSVTNGIYTKTYSARNTYISSQVPVTLGNNFEIVIKAKWGGIGSGLFNVGLNHGIQIQLSAQDFKAYFGDQESSWYVYGQVIKSSLPSNIWFWTKITYDGTDFNTYYSTDGINYTLSGTSAVSGSLRPDTIYIGCDTGFGTNGWGGDIDLNETYIKINGSLAWKCFMDYKYPVTLARTLYYDYPLSVKDVTTHLEKNGYTQIDYVESDGSQWIDLNYIPKGTTTIVSKFNIVDPLGYSYPAIFYSGETYSSEDTFGISFNNAGASRCFNVYRGSNYNIHLGEPNISLGDLCEVTLSPTIAKVKDITTNSEYSVDISGSFTSGDRSLYLFKGNSTTTDLTNPIAIRSYGLKIYEDNVIIRNYMPVKRVSDDVCGLYDILNDVFYPSSSSSDLIGHESEYKRLDCIETDGTQYIELDYVPNDTSGMKIEGASLVDSNIVWVGSREDSGDTRWSLGTNIVNTGTYTHYGWNSSGSMAQQVSVGQRITLKLNYKNNRQSEVIYYSNPEFVQKSLNLSGALTTHIEPAYLFTWNLGGSPATNLMSTMLFYGLKITEGSDVVRNYIPVVRTSDGKVGIYETISGTFLHESSGNDLIGHEVGFNTVGGNFDLWHDIMTDWSTYFNSTASLVGTSLPSDGMFECGSGKYVVLKNTNITPSANTWEIGMKFYTSQQNPGGVLWGYNRAGGGTRHRNTQIYLGNNSIGICISTDGTSWATYGSASNILQPQRWVWIKFIFDGEKYVLKVSYNNETWEDWITYNSTTPLYGFYDTTLCAGDNGNMMSAPPYCTVDLKECYLKINDTFVWRGDNTIINPKEYPITKVQFNQDTETYYVNLLSYGLREVECGYDDPEATIEVEQGTHNVLSTEDDYDTSEVENKYYEVEND